MDSRPLTLFPTTSYSDKLEHANSIPNQFPSTRATEKRPPKRTFGGETKVDLQLPKHTSTIKNNPLARPINPKRQNPETLYHCIQIIKPLDQPTICLAQERSGAGEHVEQYRVVLIRRSEIKAVFGLSPANPNVLNILAVFEYENSLFTVFDRPGVPLSQIALLPSLGVTEIKTISKEARFIPRLVMV